MIVWIVLFYEGRPELLVGGRMMTGNIYPNNIINKQQSI